MANKNIHQTFYTRQVSTLLAKTYGRSILKDSMLERAIAYFDQQIFVSSDEAFDSEKHELLKFNSIERHSHLLDICLEILELTEGENLAETNRKSAQFLGTLQLLSPTEGGKVAVNNEQCKSLYKAVLSLRLLDKLFIDNQISEPYIRKFLKNISSIQYANLALSEPDIFQQYTRSVKIPILMAALIQDIGNYHHDAQNILYGADGQDDPFRVLDIEARKKLLQTNYRETIKYLTNGLGCLAYIGDSKEERTRFNLDETQRLKFIKYLLKSSVNPKNSIGNILKVPQIYTSIVLSTKGNYNYKLLPKVYQVLNRNAEYGHCSQLVVDTLYKITGMFPQGYGVVFMPKDEFDEQADCYEYAIVNRLYPANPEEPLCRVATRHLGFMGYGKNMTIKTSLNLYFSETAKRLSTVSKDRLNEILELLASNYLERQQLDLLPRCWHANEFFSIKSQQNLWNKGGK